MSKYSPAFKRKSLAVYGTSSTGSSGSNTPPSTQRTSPTNNHWGIPPEAPKNIRSPTRSDYGFEFVSSNSVSPETMRNRPRPGERKIRGDYDDSDNDSAVSSSQSSISRGFSPPASPAPSERSSISSERSYHTSLIMDMPSRNYPVKETTTTIRTDQSQYLARPGIYTDRAYHHSSERSSSGSSSGSGSGSCSGSSPNPRSPQPDSTPRNSHIPQRQLLKRSSSTETNCSSGSSSTLTSGSQASGESLSRRVLKPQSVEAINRKNILASARCRSGRDLNGSPLIQRKFSDDEEQLLPVSGLAQDNGTFGERSVRSNGNTAANERRQVKIAYIQVTEDFVVDENKDSRLITQVAEERSESNTGMKCTSSDLMEASNDLKNWVRSEAKALMGDSPRSRNDESPNVTTARSSTLDDRDSSSPLDTRNKTALGELPTKSVESYKMKSESQFLSKDKETIVDPVSQHLLTTLTTKSRSRAPINFQDRSFSRGTSRQMSLEDILVGKAEPKLVRTQSVTVEPSLVENKKAFPVSPMSQLAPPPIVPRNNGRGPTTATTTTNESCSEDKSFVSKIPTPGRPIKGTDILVDESAKRGDRSRVSKIPTQRPLARRSASVTDMKRALEKTEPESSNANFPNNQTSVLTSVGVHHRFPSLDSSVDEKSGSLGREIQTDRFNGEQFGSITSLASTTSLISQQELAQLVEDASSLEDARSRRDVIVVLLHKENPHGSVGITLAGGVDCEAKDITVHRVLAHSIADKDGRIQRGDRILSINGRSTRGLNHRESLAVLKQPRSEVVLVVSRSRHAEEGARLRTRTDSVETIVEGKCLFSSSDDP